MANLTIEIDLPEGVTITGYHRIPDAHGVEVSWPMPESCCCPRCKTVEPARLETNLDVGKTRVVRDLVIFEQPCFFCYQAVFHRCAHCHHRQDLLPPFKRKDTGYTYRFEKRVLQMLIGSNEAAVARRLTAWIMKLLAAFPEMDRTFVMTYERWQDGILNYFDGRHTSGPVEGINNKARVITKRAYGLKSASSLWTRLVLDLNLAAEAIGQTIEEIRATVATFRPIFSAACT